MVVVEKRSVELTTSGGRYRKVFGMQIVYQILAGIDVDMVGRRCSQQLLYLSVTVYEDSQNLKVIFSREALAIRAQSRF